MIVFERILNGDELQKDETVRKIAKTHQALHLLVYANHTIFSPTINIELVSGVFVRIKDKNLHVECFKCATCGTSLKNQGYFNLHNKLYCDIHARMAALNSPPPNANGLVPVTFPT